MRGGHTKQKAAPKKIENVAINDAPSSTARRSKAIRGKEEADSVPEQGRRRRTSSRSRSGDKTAEEKGLPKTRSGEIVSCTSRGVGKRNVGTPKKLESEKCKPNSNKESDKNLTPFKRKTTRREAADDDEEVTAKLRTPQSDKNAEKRSLRGTKQSLNVGQGVRTKEKPLSVAAKEDKTVVDGNGNKRKANEVVSAKTQSSRDTPENERTDSETESETELSGEYVYVDTDEGEKKASNVDDHQGNADEGEKKASNVDDHQGNADEGEKKASNVDDHQGNANEDDVETKNTDADKDEGQIEESVVDSGVVSKADDDVHDEQPDKNIDESRVPVKVEEDPAEITSSVENSSHELVKSESIVCSTDNVNKDADLTTSELSKLASVDGEQSGESEVLSAELELHLDDSFEHESSEMCEKTPSEVKNDSVAEKEVNNLVNEETQCSGNAVKDDFHNMELEALSAGTNPADSESTDGLVIADVKNSCDETKTNVDCKKIEDSTEEATSDQKSTQSLWLEHSPNVGGDCTDDAVGEPKRQSIHRTGVDSDSCSTVSTNNEVNSPGSHQGRSKHRGPIRPGIDFTQGSRLEACDFMAKWYPSKIIDVDWKEHEVLIHFERWSSRFDEWVSMDSPRLRAITRTSARKEFRQKLQEVYKIGETVLARWVDGKMYPAKVAAFNPNGSFQVVFHDDGIQKTVKYTNISKLKEDQALQLSLDKVTAPLLPEKKKIFEGPSRSSSREKKPPKRSLSPDDVPSLVGKSPKLQKKPERMQDAQDQKPKRILKNEKRVSTSGVAVKRRKLIVGGIFQAKRPQSDADSPKRSTPIQRSQSTANNGSNRKPAKRPRLDLDVETQPKDSEAKPEIMENVEASLLGSEVAADEELGEDGQIKKKLSGGHAPKEFIIEEDHNHFKCPIDDCGKGFRKETLLASHMKHYHKTGNKTDGRRRNESECSRGESVSSKVSVAIDTAKESTVANEKHEAEKRNARSKLFEIQKKPEPICDPFAELPTEDKDVKKIRTKPESLPTKPRETGKKGPVGSRQKTEDGKQPGTQRRRMPNDASKGERKRIEVKAKAGPSHSQKEDDKDSVKPRNTGVKEKLKRRKVGALRGLEKHVPESAEDECPSKMMAFGDENASPVKDPVLGMVASPRGSEQSTGSQNIRRSGKKRKPGLASSQSKEEFSSSVGDSGVLRSPIELGEFPAYEDDDDGGREEVVNCICRIREEDGLMMQCENCMAWQHGACFNIEEEEKVPNKYICFACKNPQGQRESYRYWYDQDWWKVGEMACFNFLPKDHHPQSMSGSMYKTHALASSVYSVDHVLRSLRVKLEVAKNLEHPDLPLWNQPWSDGNQCGSNPAVVQTPGGSANSKQKGELSYCDHSYSAPNRNVFSKQEVLFADTSPLSTSEEILESIPNTEVKPLTVKSDSLNEAESTSTPDAENTTTIRMGNVSPSQNEPVAVPHQENVVLSQADSQKEASEQPAGCISDVKKVGNGLENNCVEAASSGELVANSSDHPSTPENKAQIGDEGSVTTDIDSGLASASATTSPTPVPKTEEGEVKEELAQSQVSQNTVPSKVEVDQPKPLPQEVTVKVEPTPPGHPVTVGKTVDPIDCQLHLLDHIEQMQEELDRRLEEISQHVESLEMEYDIPAAASHRETLADMPSTKRLVRLMQFNLSKVQRMAALQ